MTRTVVERAPDEDQGLSLYPLSFEETLQAALAVDPKDLDSEEGEPDGAE